MGKYDVLDKAYFGAPEHLAELITNGVYRGRLKVLPEDLVRMERKQTIFYDEGSEHERDSIYLCKKHRVKYGMEIENYADYSMPCRFLIYDAGDYNEEALVRRKNHKMNKDLSAFEERKSGMRRGEMHYGIINCVLYLGQGRYKGSRDVREYLNTNDMHPLVVEKLQNYSFTVIEADYVNPEDYKTELRQVFESMQARGNKEKLKQLFQEDRFQNLSRETQRIIAVHLDYKFIINKVIEEEVEMCKAMRDWEKELREEGRVEGREEGRMEDKREVISILMEKLHMTIGQTMDLLCIPEGERALYQK